MAAILKAAMVLAVLVSASAIDCWQTAANLDVSAAPTIVSSNSYCSLVSLTFTPTGRSASVVYYRGGVSNGTLAASGACPTPLDTSTQLAVTALQVAAQAALGPAGGTSVVSAPTCCNTDRCNNVGLAAGRTLPQLFMMLAALMMTVVAISVSSTGDMW